MRADSSLWVWSSVAMARLSTRMALFFLFVDIVIRAVADLRLTLSFVAE